MSENQQSGNLQEQDAAFVNAFEQAIIANQERISQYDAKYGNHESSEPTNWQIPGAVKDLTRTEHGFILTCEQAFVELIWFADDTLRVRVQTDNNNFSDYFSYYVRDDLKPSEAQLILPKHLPNAEEDNSELYIETASHTYIITTQDFGITIETKLGEPIYNEFQGARWSKNGRVGLCSQLWDDEASYGTGERAFDLNLRGRKLAMWNVDPAGYSRGDDPVNTCVTFYLGVHNHGAYGLLWDNSSRGQFDIGATKRDELSIESEAGLLSYYLFAGETVNDVLSAYSRITGTMPMPPLWALGYHQSHYSYRNAENVLETAKILRQRAIPCDAIYLDIHYMDDYKVFTHDLEAFPDLKGMIDELHAMGFKLVPILDPGIKIEDGYEGHDHGAEERIFLQYPDGEFAAGVVWPGLCHFPDFSNPSGRAYWKREMRDLLNAGIDGIWNDMNEPLIFNHDGKPPRELPDYVRHDKDGRGGTHLELHNVYGMQMGQASRAALAEHRTDKRPFSIIRAGAAGAQRDSIVWTGDNHSTWDDLRLSVSMTLQLGLSGISFAGADIGGFNLDTTGELLTRWTQAGSLMPFFRNHSAVNCSRQEPWRFDTPYEDAIVDAINLRYRLMPYLYTAFAECAFDGHPIIQPLFMSEPQNPNLRGTDDCYVLGDKLLVAPIMTQAALRRTVYLPSGDWYNFHTNERHEGSQLITVEAPLDTLPLFVRSGTVLPMWPLLQHMDETPVTELTLRAYVDMGETRIYEDAGEGLEYQEGAYRWVYYTCDESSNHFTVTRRVVGNYQPAYTQIRLEIAGASKNAVRIVMDGADLDSWSYEDGIITTIVSANFNTVEMFI